MHGNAPAHRAIETHNKLAHLVFQYLDHPPYSPYLAQSVYQLFPAQKMKFSHFSSDT
jgi:adenosylmethionine-8-amino-7-oxononanoate aminotransferase